MANFSFTNSATTNGTIDGESAIFLSNDVEVFSAEVTILLAVDRRIWTDSSPLNYTANIINESSDFPYLMTQFDVGPFDPSVHFNPGTFVLNDEMIIADENITRTAENHILATFEPDQIIIPQSGELKVTFQVVKEEDEE